MPNMSLQKHPMPTQDAGERSKNFREVALGYDVETALDEAKRCLNCKTRPCVGGCPVRIHIPEFIAKVAEGEFEEAYQIIQRSSSLPAVCGRVCPQETQCEQQCVRGKKGEPVAIGRLERFVADWHNAHSCDLPHKAEPNGHKVAVVGSGPAGLTCAGDLAKRGYDVTVFEALHLAGGVLVYGIPEFRLPKAIVEKEIENLKALGVKVETNMVIGRVLSVDELLEEQGFEAVFVGSGAGLPRFMNIPGENLKSVFSANEFLTRVNLMKAYKEDARTPVFHAKKVAVVGGGNVAMDAARCAKRLGAEEVSIVYRRSQTELPARAEEVEHAKEEGIVFRFLTNPTAKMSKSENEDTGRILVMDTPETIMRQFKRAITDSDTENCVRFDRENKPGVSNLMTIYSACTGKTYEQIEQEFAGCGYGKFKPAVGEAVVETLRPIREETNRLLKDKAYLENVYRQGAEKASYVAEKTLRKVYKKVGFIPR